MVAQPPCRSHNQFPRPPSLALPPATGAAPNPHQLIALWPSRGILRHHYTLQINKWCMSFPGSAVVTFLVLPEGDRDRHGGVDGILVEVAAENPLVRNHYAVNHVDGLAAVMATVRSKLVKDAKIPATPGRLYLMQYIKQFFNRVGESFGQS